MWQCIGIFLAFTFEWNQVHFRPLCLNSHLEMNRMMMGLNGRNCSYTHTKSWFNGLYKIHVNACGLCARVCVFVCLYVTLLVFYFFSYYFSRLFFLWATQILSCEHIRVFCLNGTLGTFIEWAFLLLLLLLLIQLFLFCILAIFFVASMVTHIFVANDVCSYG